MAKDPHTPILSTEDHQHERKKWPKRSDAQGRELVSPVPMAPPIGYVQTPSLAEQIRAMVRSEELRRAAEESGMETFEEADDFDVEDFDPHSPYETDFDVPLPSMHQFMEEAAREIPERPAATPPATPLSSSGSTAVGQSPEPLTPSQKGGSAS